MIGCDLGSNTFRVVSLDCESGERIEEFEKIVRLAEGIAQTGRIAEGALKRLIAAIEEAKGRFDFSSQKHRCVATAAMRMADNAEEIAARIAERTGLHFEIIDAQEEARLTLEAVRHRVRTLGLAADSMVLLDLGGGSTEMTLVENEKIVSRSVDVGIVTMTERYRLEELDARIDTAYAPLCALFDSFVAHRGGKRPDRFVATAGTPTTIAAFLEGMRYERYDYRRINGRRISVAQLHRALERLLEMPPEARRKWVGVGREDLIVAGVVMVERLLRRCGYEEMIVIDDGLREGVALDLCRKDLANRTIISPKTPPQEKLRR